MFTAVFDTTIDGAEEEHKKHIAEHKKHIADRK